MYRGLLTQQQRERPGRQDGPGEPAEILRFPDPNPVPDPLQHLGVLDEEVEAGGHHGAAVKRGIEDGQRFLKRGSQRVCLGDF